jgi:uncharacterized membrane protein YkvA (DUF1232 family)
MDIKDIKDIELRKYEKNFSEKSFLEKVLHVGKSIGGTVVYPTLLLYHLWKSPAVTTSQKAVVAGALGYFIFPMDLIPDFLVGFGYTDDMVALTAALTALANCFNDSVQDAAKAHLKSVLGDYDDRAVEATSKIIQAANRLVNFKNPLKKEGAQQPEPKKEEKKTPVEITDVEEIK